MIADHRDGQAGMDSIGLTDTWVDKLAIQDLINRYADGVNRADWEQVRSVYADHAVWESPALGMRYETAQEFCDMLAQTQTTSQLLVQTTHSTVVRLTSPDTATATTTIHEISIGTNLVDGAFGVKAGEQINFEDYGIYFDKVRRYDGRWLFVHRLFVPLYVKTGSATGDVVTPRISIPSQPMSR
jgi:ketosteroid isomerase-like protein